MSGLLEHLKGRIAAEGAITVADYMGECLGHPEFGYYLHKEPFGEAGDFITAPEISQMFGELLGLWAVHQWHALGKPEAFHLVELGPGRGTLMADALRAASGLPEFIDAMQLHLVETSPRLREKQKAALAAFRPQWHDDISNLPDGPFILLANEFFDALPIHQFEHGAHGWLERRIGLDASNADRLAFTPWPPSFPVDVLAHHIGQPGIGEILETSPVSLQIVTDLAARCQTQGGYALIIDYGHAQSGYGDTLQAMGSHQFADVLSAPGEVDLTAHVDFEALGRAAAVAGATAYGPAPQGLFLNALGIQERTEALRSHATAEQVELLVAGRDRLVDDDKMGTLFKVLVIGGDELPAPSGFQGG